MGKIIGLMGQSGAGKDTFADYTKSKFNSVKLALADPMKRICRDVYGFTEKQLWGPSEERNKPDKRYGRGFHWVCQGCFDLFHPDGDVEEKTIGTLSNHPCFYCSKTFNYVDLDRKKSRHHLIETFLTPRVALQLLGTEWGRTCFEDTWVNKAIVDSQYLLNGSSEKSNRYPSYSSTKGMNWATLSYMPYPFVTITDCRFGNEVRAIHKAGGLVIQLVREGKDGNISGGVAGHASEAEQKTLKADIIVAVPEGIPAYHTMIDEVLRQNGLVK